MWRNVRWITFGQFGMALSMTIVESLMYLRLRAERMKVIRADLPVGSTQDLRI